MLPHLTVKRKTELCQKPDPMTSLNVHPEQADAVRKPFAVSRVKRSKMNDADRLKKYLKRFELTWDQVSLR